MGGYYKVRIGNNEVVMLCAGEEDRGGRRGILLRYYLLYLMQFFSVQLIHNYFVHIHNHFFMCRGDSLESTHHVKGSII